MKNLNIKAFGGLLFLVVILAAALFIPAGTLAYWQAWVFLGVFAGSVFAITYYLMKKDPQLLERRVEAGPGAEQQRSQKIIQSVAQVAFIIVFILPALDHRNAWSSVPLIVELAGDILVALGLLIVFLVFKEKTFTAAVIAVGAEQKIVSTGPYAFVRHPMYIGALIMLAGVPLSLGSWWGLLTVVPITIVIIFRLLDEEKFLAKNLAGYPEYMNKVRYHLIPFIW
jgi:protein-S-isoprenylcysteine O-methyltransferase Ste14